MVVHRKSSLREVGLRATTSGALALCDDGPQLGVLRLLVPSQVDFALKRAAAQIARERLESGVFAGVRDQVAGLAEGFAAYGAFVGFFT